MYHAAVKINIPIQETPISLPNVELKKQKADRQTRIKQKYSEG